MKFVNSFMLFLIIFFVIGSCVCNNLSDNAKNKNAKEYPKELYRNKLREAYMLNDSIIVTIDYIDGGSDVKTKVYNIKQNIQITKLAKEK